MERKELLSLVGRAVLEDASLETGATRVFPQGLLVEISPAFRAATNAESDSLLAATQERFEADQFVRALQNPEYEPVDWQEVRAQLAAELPPIAEQAHDVVARARDLIVEALNGDEFPETANATALGEQRFRLDLFDGEQWLGTVAAFADHYLHDLAHYWPERAKDAPGLVFALRLIKLRTRGGAPTEDR